MEILKTICGRLNSWPGGVFSAAMSEGRALPDLFVRVGRMRSRWLGRSPARGCIEDTAGRFGEPDVLVC